VRFVNWQAVNTAYCGVMWMIVLVLALVILVHGLPQGAPAAHRAVTPLMR
jgi:hypothetical protein